MVFENIPLLPVCLCASSTKTVDRPSLKVRSLPVVIEALPLPLVILAAVAVRSLPAVISTSLANYWVSLILDDR